jgi:predicted DNA-binding transcriptional regulator YafY
MKSQERRLKLILLLQTRSKHLTVNYLADYFGVSRRTIFRDIRFISELNVPVSYAEGEGYLIPRGYDIPPMMFTEKELSIIMVGLSFVKSQQDAQMVEDAKSVQLKIQNVVQDRLRDLIKVLDEGLIVDPYVSKGLSKTTGGDWYAISNAIANKNEITFNYVGSKTKRTIEPYLLVYFSDHWNVIGYDKSKKGIRNFKIDRISDLDPMGQPITSNKNYSVDDLIYAGSGELVNIKLSVDKAIWSDFKRSVPSNLLSVDEKVNTYVCTFEFNNLDYINRWLLRFGTSVKILLPSTLVDNRAALLQEMMRVNT